jgi:hypothetical protein
MLYGKQLVTGEELILLTHVPKTGGSSLRRSLAKLVGTNARAAKGSWWKPKNLEEGETADTRLIAGHFKYGRHVHFKRTPLYLTVVRDPIKRFFSWYHYIQRLPNHPKHAVIGGRSMEDALALAIEHEYSCTNNDQCARLALEKSFKAAQSAVDSNYFIAASTEQLAGLNEAIWRAYAPGSVVRELQHRKARPAHSPDELTPKLKRMLEATSPEDFLLHDYVRRQFAEILRDALPIVRSAGYNALVTLREAGQANDGANSRAAAE